MSLIIGPDGRPLQPEPSAVEPEVDLPRPESAPEDTWALPDERVAALLDHEHLLVRQYAVEQVAHRQWDDPSGLEVRLDDDPAVSTSAAQTLEALKHQPAADRLVARLAQARDEEAAAISSAIATLAPERLLPALKERGRLDDEAFAGAVTALAISGREDARAYIDRALSRANVVSPDRRSAVYAASLLSGDPRLVGRVLGQALSESTREAPPEGSVHPARAAFAGLAGGPPEYAQNEAHAELWRVATDTLEMEAPPFLDDEAARELSEGLRERRADRVLGSLEAIAELEPAALEGDDAEDLGTMPARRKGLLSELIRQRAAIARVGPEASAVFVAVAARAAAILTFGHRDDVESPGTRAVVEALDGAVSAAELLEGDEAHLVEVLAGKGERDIRTLLVGMVRNRFRRAGTIRRIARVLFTSGHGAALLAAAGESSDPRVHGAVVRAALARRAPAEQAVLSVLGARPLDPQAAPFAMVIAEQLRTERVALALGASFFELRDLDRSLLARAILRCGDLRLLPLIESRAFPEEPEEAVWVILSLIAGTPVEGRLQAALDRVMGGGEEPKPLRVPLRCGSCGETLVYGFEHAYIDPKAESPDGDPIFAGDTICKACGTPDRLEPTEETTRILTGHMMQFLSELQAGRPFRPLVTPAQTSVGGREVGMAEAFRTLSKNIESSPDSIRPRLHRARLGLLLRRSTVKEDLAKVFELDPTSVEARALEAQQWVRDGEAQAAMDRCAELVRELRADEEPRIYDVASGRELREGLEDLMLELSEENATTPADLDLGEAELRREAREAAAQRDMANARGPESMPR